MKSSVIQLFDLLCKVSKPDNEFSGLGVILYSHAENLPIESLSATNGNLMLPVKGWDKTRAVLEQISYFKDPLHDGFHLIDEDGNLTHVAQYFAPSINTKIRNVRNGVGARYRSAQHGSTIEGVIAIGVTRVNAPPCIFENGIEINVLSFQ